MKTLILLLSLAVVAVTGCTSDDNHNHNGMSGAYQNQAVNPPPGTYANQSMDKNAPPNQTGGTNNPPQ